MADSKKAKAEADMAAASAAADVQAAMAERAAKLKQIKEEEALEHERMLAE